MQLKFKEEWAAYLADKSEYNLNRLIKLNSLLVEHVYHKHFSQFDKYYENFISWGLVGLWRAITKWPDDMSRPFGPFAYGCIFRTMYSRPYKNAIAKKNNFMINMTDIQDALDENHSGIYNVPDTRSDSLSRKIEIDDANKILSEIFENESDYEIMFLAYGMKTPHDVLFKKHNRQSGDRRKKRWKTKNSMKSQLNLKLMTLRKKYTKLE